MLLLPELVSGLVGDILFVDFFDIPEIYFMNTKFTHVYLKRGFHWRNYMTLFSVCNLSITVAFSVKFSNFGNKHLEHLKLITNQYWFTHKNLLLLSCTLRMETAGENYWSRFRQCHIRKRPKTLVMSITRYAERNTILYGLRKISYKRCELRWILNYISCLTWYIAIWLAVT